MNHSLMASFLLKSQRRELLDELSRERSRRYAERIKTVLLIDDGETMADIARFLFLDEGTVRNWRQRYEGGGIEKLLSDNYVGRIALLDKDQIAILQLRLSERVYSTTKEIIKLVEELFGVKYTIGGMTSLLLGWAFHTRNPRGFLPKQTLMNNASF